MERVGIVGAAGDLGARMTIQVCSAFEDVYTFDVSPESKRGQQGIDPTLDASQVTRKTHPVSCLDEMLDVCSVVHWAAPIGSVQTIPLLPESAMLVLHDSVMNNSKEAAQQITKRKDIVGQVAIAHCLMNDTRAVAVANDLGEADRIVQHIAELGLEPKLLSIAEHDVMMAHSQGLFAIICRLYRKDLEEYARQGLLTPSGQRLLVAIEDNESRWTPTTFSATVRNPELESVVHAMAETLRRNTSLDIPR